MNSASTTLRTLFVRGVTRSFDDEAFRAIFEGQKGILNCFLVHNRGGGSATGHKGIGFVEFDTNQNAKAALEALKGRRVGDRELKIEFAKGREAFGERKKRKLQSLKQPKADSSAGVEEDPFGKLGVHARVRSIAVGGVTADLLSQVESKAKAIGKVEQVTYPVSSLVCSAARLYQDGCPPEVAIVTFESVAVAMKAVSQLHDVEMASGGKEVKLWCRQVSGEGAYVKRNKIIIRNLPFKVDAAQLHDLLSSSGFVWKLDVVLNKGFAFAYFTTRAHAQKAIKNANGQGICGRVIAVDWAVSKKQYNQQEEVAESDADEKVKNLLRSMTKENQTELETKPVIESKLQPTEKIESAEDDLSELESESSENSEVNAEEETPPSDPKERKIDQGQNSELDNKRKAVPDKTEDLSRTVFVSGLNLDVTEDALKVYLERFGPLKSIFLVKNKETGKSKGTAFVEFVNEADKERALETFDASKKDKAKKLPSAFGLSFSLKQAVSRSNLKTIVTARKQEKQKADRRNLYLLQEGKIEEGTPAWNELSRTDQAIRKRSAQLKREKLKNPLFFVSKTRLCIRNLPSATTESSLERLVVDAIQQRASRAQPVVRQVKLLYDETHKGNSLRRGFVELDVHEHAICALRQLNANPDVFGAHRRPIVEFAIDNREIINKRETQIQKLKNQALEKGKEITDVTFGFGKKKRKGKNERQREKLKHTKPETPVKPAIPKKPVRTKKTATQIPTTTSIATKHTTGRRKPGRAAHPPRQPRKRTQTTSATISELERPAKRIKGETKDKLDILANAYRSQNLMRTSSPKLGSL